LKATNLRLINKPLWNVTNYGTHNCNPKSKDDYEVNEFRREKLETIVKKLKNGKVSELLNYASEKI